MKQFLAVLAFAIALPMSNPAHAYIKCDKIEKASKKKKCEKKMDKRLAKMRANQTPIKTSDVGKEFAYLDSKKLFESDDWFLGYKNSGYDDIDALNEKIARAKGVLRLARYAAYVNKTDKKAAKDLGGKLMPRLKNIQEELDAISAQLEKVNMEQYTGMDAMKANVALVESTAALATIVGEVPGALAALGPIVGGGLGDMVNDAVQDASGGVINLKPNASK